MELEFELNEYANEGKGEFGAVLVVNVTDIQNVIHDLIELNINGSTLFTYDKDGGEKRQLEVDPFDYITKDELLEEVLND